MSVISYAYSALEVFSAFKNNSDIVVTIYQDKTSKELFPANHVNLSGTESEKLQRLFVDLREITFDRHQEKVTTLGHDDVATYLAKTKRELESLTRTDLATIAKAKTLSLTAKKEN